MASKLFVALFILIASLGVECGGYKIKIEFVNEFYNNDPSSDRKYIGARIFYGNAKLDHLHNHIYNINSGFVDSGEDTAAKIAFKVDSNKKYILKLSVAIDSAPFENYDESKPPITLDWSSEKSNYFAYGTWKSSQSNTLVLYLIFLTSLHSNQKFNILYFRTEVKEEMISSSLVISKIDKLQISQQQALDKRNRNSIGEQRGAITSSNLRGNNKKAEEMPADPNIEETQTLLDFWTKKSKICLGNLQYEVKKGSGCNFEVDSRTIAMDENGEFNMVFYNDNVNQGEAEEAAIILANTGTTKKDIESSFFNIKGSDEEIKGSDRKAKGTERKISFSLQNSKKNLRLLTNSNILI